MGLITRIIGLALLTAGLGVGLGFVFFGNDPDGRGISLFLACVGGIIGAVAGAAREIVQTMGTFKDRCAEQSAADHRPRD